MQIAEPLSVAMEPPWHAGSHPDLMDESWQVHHHLLSIEPARSVIDSWNWIALSQTLTVTIVESE
jgi:hypothetical protein